MSELPANIERQKQYGYLMLASAAMILIAGIVAVWLSSLHIVGFLGFLIPVSLMVIFGYRALSAARNQKALADERTIELYGEVGLNSFWTLMAIIMFDDMLNIFPLEDARSAYILIGLSVYGLFFVYYRYIEK